MSYLLGIIWKYIWIWIIFLSNWCGCKGKYDVWGGARPACGSRVCGSLVPRPVNAPTPHCLTAPLTPSSLKTHNSLRVDTFFISLSHTTPFAHVIPATHFSFSRNTKRRQIQISCSNVNGLCFFRKCQCKIWVFVMVWRSYHARKVWTTGTQPFPANVPLYLTLDFRRTSNKTATRHKITIYHHLQNTQANY